MSAVSRRSFLQSAGLGALSALSASAQGPRASGPNVLMIAIDDLNDWIGVLGGNAQTLTPNIDALAARGKEPVFKASAIRGVGVLETLLGLMKNTWRHLEATHQLEEKFGVRTEPLLAEMRTHLGVKTDPAPEARR